MNSVSSVSDKISNLIWSQLQLLTNCRGLDLHLVRQEGEVLGRGYISIFIWPFNIASPRPRSFLTTI